MLQPRRPIKRSCNALLCRCDLGCGSHPAVSAWALPRGRRGACCQIPDCVGLLGPSGAEEQASDSQSVLVLAYIQVRSSSSSQGRPPGCGLAMGAIEPPPHAQHHVTSPPSGRRRSSFLRISGVLLIPDPCQLFGLPAPMRFPRTHILPVPLAKVLLPSRIMSIWRKPNHSSTRIRGTGCSQWTTTQGNYYVSVPFTALAGRTP